MNAKNAAQAHKGTPPTEADIRDDNVITSAEAWRSAPRAGKRGVRKWKTHSDFHLRDSGFGLPRGSPLL